MVLVRFAAHLVNTEGKCAYNRLRQRLRAAGQEKPVGGWCPGHCAVVSTMAPGPAAGKTLPRGAGSLGGTCLTPAGWASAPKSKGEGGNKLPLPKKGVRRRKKREGDEDQYSDAPPWSPFSRILAVFIIPGATQRHV
jgi:hypothetical protein